MMICIALSVAVFVGYVSMMAYRYGIADLNPAIRERQETERRFSSIENSVNGLKGMVQSLLDKLA